jgi:hypothetical protein
VNVNHQLDSCTYPVADATRICGILSLAESGGFGGLYHNSNGGKFWSIFEDSIGIGHISALKLKL